MNARQQPGLRPPSQVMRLERLGAMHPTRLSFLRALLRRMQQENWRTDRSVWNIDSQGFGHAVYVVSTPDRRYSLVAFSQELEAERRTDRVIAEAWDTAYVLYDGVPNAAELERLRANAPKQEAGRFSSRDLVLSRANKSVRLFDTIAHSLAAGRQPDAALINDVGYLMRTTAVYGNGKFGIADRAQIASRPEFSGPFQAEMLTVWLIRAFTVDLVEHVAESLAPGKAARLAPELRRLFGVGNSTGLGMAPFLVRHPVLIHHWMQARETALSRVRSVTEVDPAQIARFRMALRQAHTRVSAWRTDDPVQAPRIRELADDVARLSMWFNPAPDNAQGLWDRVYEWAEANLGVEAQEYVVSMLLETNPELVDDLSGEMAVDEAPFLHIDGAMTCYQLQHLLERHYAWALSIDFSADSSLARFWYVSAEKLEPRLGERDTEPGADLEQPLTFARDVHELRYALQAQSAGTDIATFLRKCPCYRHIVRRVQIASRYPYAEIRDNLIDAHMRPVDLLRCKLAFFGANRFDPRSDRWLRICLFQGAPFPGEHIQDPADEHAQYVS